MKSQSKRIILFKSGMSSGGAEHQLAFLAEGLNKSGYRVSVLTFADYPDHYVLSQDIRRIRLAEGRSKLYKAAALFFFFLTVRCDAIICFGQRESYLCLKSLFLRPGVKVICGERNLTKGHSSIYEKALISHLYNRSSWIVSNSYSQMNHILNLSAKLSPKLRTIINYTDLDHYYFQLPPNNEILKVAIFARFDKQKNYSRFVEAIKQSEVELRGRILFVWYGNTESSGAKNQDYILFSHLIQCNGISDILSLRNHVTDVPKEMSLYDAVCLPSLFEGFSNSIAEAISCGKPMLVSDVSDNHIMVKDGVNGFLFDPENTDSIVASIMSFIALSTEERKSMGQKSRIIAESLFDNELFINSYIELIER